MSRILAAFLLLTAVGSSADAGVTYNIVAYTQYQDGWELKGQITTDGTIGDLTGHITAWNWYTSNGTRTWEFNSTQSGSSLEINGVSATADGKIVMERIAGGTTSQMNKLLLGGFSTEVNSGIGLYWRTGALGPELPSNIDGYSILGTRRFPLPAWGVLATRLELPSKEGPIVIATAAPVPEPAGIASALLGIAGVALRSMTRRRKAAGASQS